MLDHITLGINETICCSLGVELGNFCPRANLVCGVFSIVLTLFMGFRAYCIWELRLSAPSCLPLTFEELKKENSCHFEVPISSSETGYGDSNEIMDI